MNILLTGANGFIGRQLTQHFDIFRVVTRSEGEKSDCDSFNVTSIDDSTSWDGAFDNVHSVIHLAGLAHNSAYSDSAYSAVNTKGTLRLALKSAEAGVKRFVFVSSIGVNGTVTHDNPFLSNDAVNPHNFYALSKYEAEQGLWDISKQTGLEVVIVRPTLVYGINAPGNFGMLTKLVEKSPFLPFGLANNRRDFISVQNLADLLIVCAGHKSAAGNIFLASESQTVSIKDFTNAMGQGLGKKVVQIPVPVSLMMFLGRLTGKSAMIEQLFGDLQVDSSNLKLLLDWTPPFSMKQAMLSLRNSSK